MRDFHDPAPGNSSKAVLSLSQVKGKIWAGTESGISVLSSGEWKQRCRGWPSGPVDFIFNYGDQVLVNDGRLHIQRDGAWTTPDEPTSGLRADVDKNGMLWLVAEDGLWTYDGKTWKNVRRMGRMGIGFRDFKCLPDGTAVAATDRGLFFLQGKRLYWFHVREKSEGLLSNDTRSAVPDGSGNIWVATDRGLSIYSGGNGWCSITGKEKLPYEDLKALQITPWGDYWISTDVGLILLKDGRWKYFSSKRWLPHDVVNAVFPAKDGEVWAATPDGISHIQSKQMTLLDKAKIYEDKTWKFHNRMGFITKRGFTIQGDISSGSVNISDNDGLWTSLYIAAEAYRYAVTGEEEAKNRAMESLKSLIWLEEITGIPGFPARAIRGKKDPRFGDGHPEWHLTQDGKWEWKGDTSSDEIDGHYFGGTIYYDLVANKEEKTRISKFLGRMTDHIIDNGYYLIDVHGENTTWGVWAPEKLNYDDRWRMQRGLNSLEILSYLRSGYHVTGNKRYLDEYYNLAVDEHYAINTVKQRQTVFGQQVWHDDRLAYLAYYPLLLYEEDPSLRQVYLLSLERTWRQIRGQRNSLWNIITSVGSGSPHDMEAATDTLGEYPLDLIYWTVKNSHRTDIEPDPNRPNTAMEPLPADERPIHEWAGNLHDLDGGNNGMGAMDGTWYLLPYWMGRYHGLIP